MRLAKCAQTGTIFSLSTKYHCEMGTPHFEDNMKSSQIEAKRAKQHVPVKAHPLQLSNFKKHISK